MDSMYTREGKHYCDLVFRTKNGIALAQKILNGLNL